MWFRLVRLFALAEWQRERTVQIKYRLCILCCDPDKWSYVLFARSVKDQNFKHDRSLIYVYKIYCERKWTWYSFPYSYIFISFSFFCVRNATTPYKQEEVIIAFLRCKEIFCLKSWDNIILIWMNRCRWKAHCMKSVQIRSFF